MLLFTRSALITCIATITLAGCAAVYAPPPSELAAQAIAQEKEFHRSAMHIRQLIDEGLVPLDDACHDTQPDDGEHGTFPC